MSETLLMEFLKRKNKTKLITIEYDAKQVKKEINNIMNDVKKLLSKPEYKEVYKHGMSISSLSDTMEDKEPEDGKYKSGENFWIVRFDLHEFTKCNPRNYEEDGYKKHPVEEASEKLKGEVKSLVDKKYPNYDVEVDGDWDTFALEVVLKNGSSIKETANAISDEPLIEFFKRKNKEKVKWTPTEDDKVISVDDVGKYKSLFNSVVKVAEDISKKTVRNAKLDTDDVEVIKIDKGDYVELGMFKGIISIPENYQNIKNQYKGIFEDVEEYSDIDGDDACEWVIKNFLNKFKSKGFKQYEYSDIIFNYIKEGKEDEFLYVQFDESYERLSVGMTVYYKNSNLQESNEISNNGEPLLELFKKRLRDIEKHYNDKKPLPKKIQKKENKVYTQDEISNDIKAILTDAKKILDKPEFKEFKGGKGLTLLQFFNAMDTAASSESEMELVSEYVTGDDFGIVDYDLWEYTKCGARTYEDEGYEEHPVITATYKFATEFRKVIDNKYPKYRVDVDGDWDTGTVSVILK